jgi:hypothetical protein
MASMLATRRMTGSRMRLVNFARWRLVGARQTARRRQDVTFTSVTIAGNHLPAVRTQLQVCPLGFPPNEGG